VFCLIVLFLIRYNLQQFVAVECPVCEVCVPEQHINKHLDMCLSRDDKKEGLRRYGEYLPCNAIALCEVWWKQKKKVFSFFDCRTHSRT